MCCTLFKYQSCDFNAFKKLSTFLNQGKEKWLFEFFLM